VRSLRPLGRSRWLLAAVHRGEARARAEPFDAIEIDLALLWAK
jgi:hypothetical protein